MIKNSFIDLLSAAWNLLPLILIPTVISLNTKNKKLNDFISQLYHHRKISDFEYRTKTCTAYAKADDNIQNNSADNTDNIPDLSQNNISNQTTQNPEPTAAPNANYIQSYNNTVNTNNNKPNYQSYYNYSNNQNNYNNIADTNISQNRKKFNSASVLFIVGTIFIILASAAFSAATWVNLSSVQRCLILLAASVFLFFVSFGIKKFFNLTNTSLSFYISGLVCFSITYLTTGYYHLMGDWFSFDGKGFYLLIGWAFFLISIITMLGRYLYKKAFLSYLSSFEMGIFALFLCLQISSYFADSYAYFSLFVTIIHAVLIALVFIYNPIDRLKKSKVFNLTAKVLSLGYLISTIPFVVSCFFLRPFFLIYVIIAIYFLETLYLGLSKNKTSFKILNSSILIAFFIIFCHNIKILLSGSWILLCRSETAQALFIFTASCCIASILYKYIKQIRTLFSDIAFYFLTGFGACLCVGFSDNYTFSAIAPIMFEVVILMYFIGENEVFSIVSSVIMPLPVVMLMHETADILSDRVDNNFIFLVFDSMLVMFTILCLFSHKQGKKYSVLKYAFAIVTAILLIVSSYRLTGLLAVLCIISLIMFLATFKSDINLYSILNIWAMISSFVRTLENIFYEPEEFSLTMLISSLIISVAFIVLSRIFYKESFVGKIGRYQLNVDMFQIASICSWLSVFTVKHSYFMAMQGNYFRFVQLIVLSFIVANFIREKTTDKLKCAIFTISAFLLTIALISRPFLVFDNYIIDHKVDLFIFALFGFAVRFIFRKYKKIAKTLSTIIHIMAYIGLMYDALFYEGIVNMLFVLVITLVILLVSFFCKSKSWFLTSSISLLVFTLFSSRHFLSQIRWWVYLFVVGILLIIIAAINEYYKNQKEKTNVKEKISEIFKGWDW